jgi:hypothetical protein
MRSAHRAASTPFALATTGPAAAPSPVSLTSWTLGPKRKF